MNDGGRMDGGCFWVGMDEWMDGWWMDGACFGVGMDGG